MTQSFNALNIKTFPAIKRSTVDLLLSALSFQNILILVNSRQPLLIVYNHFDYSLYELK